MNLALADLDINDSSAAAAGLSPRLPIIISIESYLKLFCLVERGLLLETLCACDC